ncbi:hypothetical protein CORC01_13974 [Colletotrichum orchidophilum]|uniref:Uncharacterized protein n=1 Tax=Colletotrichum orchidophilum TaxID=1209926 RepID=A0A1G4ANM6_9PEZI|nr:uncharacterized protein CORC01_13974 [Colletotrichum orchidophilum]OHE90721.1 hypothetical protein CORC01_13974 [Colletotrichum orchidophilum]
MNSMPLKFTRRYRGAATTIERCDEIEVALMNMQTAGYLEAERGRLEGQAYLVDS